MCRLDEIEALIDEVQSRQEFQVSVALYHVSTSLRFEHAAQRQSPAGSLIKLFILAATAAFVNDGRSTWDEPVEIGQADRVSGAGILKYFQLPLVIPLRQLAAYMCWYSDNIATNRLIEIVSLDYINLVAEALGATSTHLVNRMMEWDGKHDNVTTASDIGWFYRALTADPAYPLSPTVVADCWQFLELDDRPGVHLARMMSRPEGWRNLRAASRQGPISFGRFLRAVGSNRVRHRLASHLPYSVRALLRAANDRTFFHDSALLINGKNVVSVAAMIVHPGVDFRLRRSPAYIAATDFCARLGELAASSIYIEPQKGRSWQIK